MPVIPGFNKDISLITKDLNDRIHQPKQQRILVLLIVCIALLLDNMLYMVIVPIIPVHLRKIYNQSLSITTPFTTFTQTPLTTPTSLMSVGLLNNAQPFNMKELSSLNETLNDDTLRKLESSSKPKSAKPQPRVKGAWSSSTTTTTLPTPAVVENESSHEKKRGANDVKVGFLFASKAMVQLLINPFSGAFIDRIGYDIPMCIGLAIIFLSTMTFSFGNSYLMLFIARSLQGVGSAFADTSGLAMIADRFTEEGERSKALGIALAFISFGSLVAPPFGGILYQYTNESVPFILLAFVALFDGILLFFVMRPHRIAMTLQQDQQYKPKSTPIWKLFQDPYIAVCSGALVMANVSLAFLEPTIAIWMEETMGASESKIGSVWLPGFIPHLLGVLFTVWMAKRFPQYQWVLAAGGLALEGVSCFLIPFCTNYIAIMIPISGICFGIALVDTAILPTLGYLVDVRHTSVYGSIYAIADISYSLAYAFGPIVAGNIMFSYGFTALNMGICFSNLLYAPVIYFLRYFYEFKPLESNELSAISNAQSAVGGGGSGFKRFVNDESDFQQNSGFNPEYTSIDATPGLNFNNYQAGGGGVGVGGGGGGGGNVSGGIGPFNVNRPESAVFQNMAKYPKMQSKNPYKDTHNLIDNMEDEDY